MHTVPILIQHDLPARQNKTREDALNVHGSTGPLKLLSIVKYGLCSSPALCPNLNLERELSLSAQDQGFPCGEFDSPWKLLRYNKKSVRG